MIVSIKSRHQPVPRHGVRVHAQRRLRFARHVQLRGPRPATARPTRNRCGRTSSAPRSAGPSGANKTFFFGSWEGRRERYQQTDMAIVPNADERNGLFSRSLAVINDPLTRQPFPNNQVPRNRFDATAVEAARAVAAAEFRRLRHAQQLHPQSALEHRPRQLWTRAWTTTSPTATRSSARRQHRALQEPARFRICPSRRAAPRATTARIDDNAGAQRGLLLHAHHPPHAAQRIPLRLPAAGGGQARADR